MVPYFHGDAYLQFQLAAKFGASLNFYDNLPHLQLENIIKIDNF